MAKKDFDKYFIQQQKAYYQAVKALEEYGALAADNMISTEQMKQAQSVLSPTIESYKFLTYVKYLLDKPTKNQKIKQYNKQNKKVLNNDYSTENIKDKNQKILKEFTEEYVHDERNNK